MASPTVRVAIIGDAAQLKGELAGINSKLGGMQTTASKAGDTMRRVFASGVIIAGIKKMTDGAAQLEQAIGGTATVFGTAAKPVDDFSKNAAELAGLSEKTARTLTSRLGASLIGTGNSAEFAAQKSVELTQIGADLAAALGGTTEEAVTALGAALRGEYDPLERFGIALTATQVNAKAVEMGLAETTSAVDANAKQTAALSIIQEKAGLTSGQFGRELDTAAGSAAKARADFENASDQLGTTLLPIMSKAAEAVSFLVDAFSKVPEPIQLTAIALGAIRFVGGAGTFSEIAAAARGLPDLFNAAATKLYDVAGALDKINLKKAAVGFGAVAAAIGVAYVAVDKLSERWVEGRFGDFADDVDQLQVAFARLGETGAFTGVLSTDLEKLGDAVGYVNSASADMPEGIGGFLADLVGIDDELDESKSQLDAVGTAISNLALTNLPQAVSAFDSLDTALQRQGYSVEEIDAAFPGLRENLANLEDAQNDAAGAAEDHKINIDELAEAFDDATDAARDYFDTQNEGLGLSLDWEQAIDDLAASVAENGTTLDRTTEAGRNNIEALQEMGEAAFSSAEYVREHTGDLEAAKAELYANRDALIEHARELGLDEQAVADLIEEMGLTPEQIETYFSQPGLESGLAMLAQTKAYMQWMQQNRYIQVDAGINVDVRAAGDLALYTFLAQQRGGIAPIQVGGPMQAGRTYLVGERGPELLTMGGKPGHMTPNEKIGGEGGGPMVARVYLDGRQIQEALFRRERALR